MLGAYHRRRTRPQSRLIFVIFFANLLFSSVANFISVLRMRHFFGKTSNFLSVLKRSYGVAVFSILESNIRLTNIWKWHISSTGNLYKAKGYMDRPFKDPCKFYVSSRRAFCVSSRGLIASNLSWSVRKALDEHVSFKYDDHILKFSVMFVYGNHWFGDLFPIPFHLAFGFCWSLLFFRLWHNHNFLQRFWYILYLSVCRLAVKMKF